MAQFCWGLVLQLQICCCVPLTVLSLGSSRHLPDLKLRSEPLDWGIHSWSVCALQEKRMTALPFEVAPALTPMQ